MREILQTARNPLEEWIFRAAFVKQVTERLYGKLSEKQLPSYAPITTSSFSQTSGSKIIYPNKESGGVAGLYVYLRDNNYEVIFANDLSLEIHGIDAVARNKKNGNYIICESKGTAMNRIKTPSYYLKNTKHKGRQLSWEWCWASLIDFAELGTTAFIFLELIEPFLLGEIERLLSVTLLNSVEGGYAINKTKVWHESDLQIPWLKRFQFDKQKQWLKQITEDVENQGG